MIGLGLVAPRFGAGRDCFRQGLSLWGGGGRRHDNSGCGAWGGGLFPLGEGGTLRPFAQMRATASDGKGHQG